MTYSKMTDSKLPPLKTILMTAALMALPSAAFAQVPPEAAPDELKDKAVQELGEQISDEETDATILKPADPSAADKIIDDILEGGLIETAPETASEIDPDTTLNEETTPNEEWESERDKGSATTYSSPAECPGGTELAEDGSCMVLEE